MFGIGLTEMILVGLVALMLFSPRELPSLIKTLAGIYGSIRRTAEQFRAQVMEADELREPIEEIRAAYHGTKAELDGARDIARRELQRARMEVVKAQQKMNEIAREEAKRAPALGDRPVATGPSEQVPPASQPAPAAASATVSTVAAEAAPRAVPVAGTVVSAASEAPRPVPVAGAVSSAPPDAVPRPVPVPGAVPAEPASRAGVSPARAANE
ncbi:hypothetical protein OV203_09320 [Nannocystis sp. ILAH1]|uniref:hypothetical protein n=1 Tax=unclassified Nannocystis TaxID=2627009 RepID=UPI00226E5BE3|nr:MULTISPECIES: hypothetical protein [unclassified Nannocystis]MCY0987322.1 hypothetical protein [Nannocystis sp. ILAH1]MCY1070882.1 hypothetical protein [Nannocystis sp. RBIL2]